MSKERKPTVEDPGLRELSEGDLDALETIPQRCLTFSHHRSRPPLGGCT